MEDDLSLEHGEFGLAATSLLDDLDSDVAIIRADGDTMVDRLVDSSESSLPELLDKLLAVRDGVAGEVWQSFGGHGER